MSEKELSPEKIFEEAAHGRAFNNSIKLGDNVERNEYFYNDDQWHGLETQKIMKPVFNFLSRVVKFFISSVVSDDIGVSVNEFDDNAETRPVMEMIGQQFDEIMEQTRFKKLAREIIRDAAVDGDGVMHHYFDTEVAGRTVGSFAGTGGAIGCEIIPNTKLYFGNPQNADVQTQPYILLEFRRMIEDVKETAKQNGGTADAIEEDEEADRRENTPDHGKVTVIRRYWKQRGTNGTKTVWAMEVTETAVVRKAWDTGYSLYPITYMPWEKVKNSFHGKSALTGYIQNQIFVNKSFAMVMKHLENMAFPKIVYNRGLIQKWDNGVGKAIGVNGDPNAALASSFKAQDMSSQVLQSIQTVIDYSRDMMGASDAALGNVNPDNTSAILATQKATSMPLELQKQDFYCFVEDCVRIWLDMMGTNYGVRTVRIKVKSEAIQAQSMPQGMPESAPQDMTQYMPLPQGAGGNFMQTQSGQAADEESIKLVQFDFNEIKGMNLHLNVDVGAATYWSELMQAQTLDGLYQNKVITDPVTYLENVPRGYVPNRNDILESVKKEQAQLQQAAIDNAQAQALNMRGGI